MLVKANTILRQPIEEDIQALLSMRNNIELQSLLMSRAKPNTSEKINEWLKRKLSDESSVFFIIADASTNQLAGYLQFVNIDFLNRRGELGICLDPAKQGQGYAANALSLLEVYLKDVFNIKKITLQVLQQNSSAINFYLKSGYMQVGIYKEHFYQRNFFHDVLIMEKQIQ
ncbi:MAG TPA: GNAT family protein [Puia sp.]|nr:GNAT family protein [Puia sp.]